MVYIVFRLDALILFFIIITYNENELVLPVRKSRWGWEQVRKGLRDYFPSKNTFILFNKGFKNCKKNLPKQTSVYDIVTTV
jgi:hypothetical protein